MSKSIQISIQADEPRQELLISLLSDLGAEGFEQTDDRLTAYFNALQFPSYEVNGLLQGERYEMQTLEEQNWNAVWESNFPPVIVGDFCAVRAEFHAPIPGVAYELVITPKMSFGTGHHATTWMMIDAMKYLDFQGARVFDFGTGTGILAILAEKLGAASVTAIDVDDWSIRNATENVERNNCCKISLSLSTNIPSAEFDVVLANINRNVILQYLPYLEGCVRSGGHLLLSGLLTTDETDLVEACSRHHFRLVQRGERSNWISLLFVNVR